jgi:hypothetical protein
MEKNKKKISEIESELFSLVNTITNLYEKYQEGTINNNFFRKALRNAMKGLLKINLYFKEKNISLSKILKEMNFVKEYNNAIKTIDIINPHNENFRILNESHSHFAKRMKTSFLELPGITSEITSSFITLMDALKLEGLKNIEFIIKLFNNLKRYLNKFPGLEEIQLKIEKIHDHTLENTNILIENKIYREKVVDHLYNIFNEFQDKLNLKIVEK